MAGWRTLEERHLKAEMHPHSPTLFKREASDVRFQRAEKTSLWNRNPRFPLEQSLWNLTSHSSSTKLTWRNHLFLKVSSTGPRSDGVAHLTLRWRLRKRHQKAREVIPPGQLQSERCAIPKGGADVRFQRAMKSHISSAL